MNPNSLMKQTGIITIKSSNDQYGREQIASSTTVSCRAQLQTKTRFLGNGETLVIDGVVYLPAGTTVNLNDKFTFSGVSYKVHSKYSPVDGNGSVNHIKIEIIKWPAI